MWMLGNSYFYILFKFFFPNEIAAEGSFLLCQEAKQGGRIITIPATDKIPKLKSVSTSNAVS